MEIAPQRNRANTIRIAIFTVLLFVVTAPGQGQQQTDVVRSIETCLRASQFSEALALTNAALSKSPRDTRLWTLKGIAEDSQGRAREALSSFNKSLALTPHYLPALEGAAQIEYRLGSPRAGALLKRILEVRPDDATAHAMLGVLSYKRHDCPAAIAHFSKATPDINSRPRALAEYGSCLFQLKRIDEAVSIFTVLLQMNPADNKTRYNLAVVQLTASQSANALATLQPLLEGNGRDPDVLDLAAAAYEAQHNTPRAVDLLRDAIVLSPRNPKYYLDFASLSFNHKSFDIGIDMLTAGLKQLPRESSLYLARGILFVQRAQYEKGEEDFDMAEALNPAQSFSPFAQGLVKYQQSDLDGALRTVRKQLSAHPNDSSLNFLLAEILMQKGAEPGTPEFKEAVTATRTALKIEPGNVLARDMLSNLYLKSGDVEGAIAQCRLALRADRSDQTALYRLIMALRRTNRKQEIPKLVKQLADLRNEQRNEEAAQSRYTLSEPQ